MGGPFDPTGADLLRIDRARAEAWLTAHGWEALPGLLPHRAGCWWRLVGGDGLDTVHHSTTVPSDDPKRRHYWRDVLHRVARAHGLHGLALWLVLVQWQTPEGGES